MTSARSSQEASPSQSGLSGQFAGAEPRSYPELRLLVVRVIQYATNHIVSHTPSFAARHFWYRRVLGIELADSAAVHLGCSVLFYGPRAVRRTGARIGRNSRISGNCTIDVRGGLTIGDNVSVSPGVRILTASHGLNEAGFPIENRAVTIEDHVWICTGAMILPGVTLGRGAVVAAGAVVTRDAPPMTVVAGVPAKPVSVRDVAGIDYVLDRTFPLLE